MDKKGFLFTVTIFLILAYILLSISLWVKAIETSERSYSDFYKQSELELAISQVTPEKVGNTSHEIMTRNLFRLNQYSIGNPLLNGSADDQNKNVRDALFSLLLNGTADPRDFTFPYLPPIPPESSSLGAWMSNLNSSLNATGAYISTFSVTNFALNQSDIDKVNYSFDMYLELADRSGIASVSRSYHVKGNLNISGLVDPALARASQKKNPNQPIGRQFFFDTAAYKTSGDLKNVAAKQIVTSNNIKGGQGWIYGYLVNASGSTDPNTLPDPAHVAPGTESQYILVGTYKEITSVNNYQEFGGFILTNAPINVPGCSGNGAPPAEDPASTFNPIQYDGNCHASTAGWTMPEPFIVAPGFNPRDAGPCPNPLEIGNPSHPQYHCALILNKYSVSDVHTTPTDKISEDPSDGIYDIEQIRDYVMCGYYTSSPKGPSYLQRLMNDSYSLSDPNFGIETFVIGEYSNQTSGASRLDREMFGSGTAAPAAGIKIRGLPGCRDLNTCADSPPTGIFSLSDGAIKEYGLTNIECSGTGCTQ